MPGSQQAFDLQQKTEAEDAADAATVHAEDPLGTGGGEVLCQGGIGEGHGMGEDPDCDNLIWDGHESSEYVDSWQRQGFSFAVRFMVSGAGIHRSA